MAEPANPDQPPGKEGSPGSAPGQGESMPLSSGRLWLFRGLALALLPLALLLGEGAMRLAGMGYDTSFLVDGPKEGVAVSHHRFAWTFFPPALARQPIPFEIAPKAPGSRRIFVLGGSAAQGVPEPGFSVARLLQARLEMAYPEQRFEVINGAMTAINSHVVLPIAKDCAAYDPDLFVVYMGNNEVVGPYGLASVFGRFSPRLPWLRLSIALQSSRWAQGWKRLRGAPSGQGTWRGMEMFLEQQVAADDPRLRRVLDHYRRNLEEIVEVAHRAGAKVVVSTVASNLDRQPPFASKHRPGLAPDEEQRFAAAMAAGLAAMAAGEPRQALEHWEVAHDIDDRHAALLFHRGRALQALGEAEEALLAFKAARDLDTLRFRAAGRLNDIVRRLEPRTGLAIVDGAEALHRRQGRVDGKSGMQDRDFYEHVHLTFAGNDALARQLLPAVTEGLGLKAPPSISATREAVAEHLAYTAYDALVLEQAMAKLVERPPFVETWGHAEDLKRRRQEIWRLRQGLNDEVWQRSRRLYEGRLAAAQDDLLVRQRWAEHLTRRGEHGAAIDLWRQLVDRYPGGGAWHDALANSLSAVGRTDEALEALAAARRVAPERSAEILINEGRVRAESGDLDGAEELYRQAVAARPTDPIPLYNLAHLAVERQDVPAARRAFRRLTQEFPYFALGHYNLGVAEARGGDFEGSLKSFEAALKLDPHHGPTHNSHALSLEQLGRTAAAEAAYRRALEIDPGYALAAFNLADLLLARGRDEDLEEVIHWYGRGLERQPSNPVARRHLALAQRRLDATGSP